MDKIINKIFHDDYRDIKKEIQENCVDLIICDPPYGETNNDWDSTSEKDVEYLFDFFDRVRKENSPIVIFGQKQFAARLKLRENFKYDLIWEKDRPTGFLNSKKMPLRSHEEILVFYDNQPTYNPQMWEGDEKIHSIGNSPVDERCDANKNYGNYNRVVPPDSKMKYPRSVLKFKRPHPPIHPTQKPVELYDWIIKTYTNQGDLVLDPMCGSGTNAVSCVRNSRNFICIEKNLDYYKKSLRRKEEAEAEKFLEEENERILSKFFQSGND